MVTVQVSNYRNFEKAFEVFRTKVRQAHILEIANSKMHYVSPSERKHRNRVRKPNRLR